MFITISKWLKKYYIEFKVHIIYTKFIRYGNYEDFLAEMDKTEGGIEQFSQGYKMFGPQVFTNIKYFVFLKNTILHLRTVTKQGQKFSIRT